jgi:nicotinamidase-related amidase
MSKVAILTNDLQYDLVNKNSERQKAVADATPLFVEFLNAMRDSNQLVVHLQLINEPDDPNAERYDGYLPVQRDTEGAAIIADFLDPRDVVMEKTKDSGFFDTDLDAVLRGQGVETVVVTGMQTQICVQTTAADAFFRGYSVWVPRDGVVSARTEDKERALEWLEGYCATVSDAADIIERVRATGELPRKQIVTP